MHLARSRAYHDENLLASRDPCIVLFLFKSCRCDAVGSVHPLVASGTSTDYPDIFHDTILVNVSSSLLDLTRVCHLWRRSLSSPGQVTSFNSNHFSRVFFSVGSLALAVYSSPFALYTVPHDAIALAANSRLLDIFLSESKHLEMVVMLMLHLCGWDINFDTPRLRALECDFLVFRLSKFYAPNISRLRLNTNFHYLVSTQTSHSLSQRSTSSPPPQRFRICFMLQYNLFPYTCPLFLVLEFIQRHSSR
ncbi:hypothetical protein BDR06DRAFT_86927 [Suillus hirtellus]|nr:hypothetical protein BDR06DRAFT_86927 [Suillus hirtellus]